jgi:hypothetical protein
MIAVVALVVLLGVQGALGAIIEKNDDIKVFRWSASPAGQNPSAGPFWAVIYDDAPDTGVGSGTTIEPRGEGLTFCVEIHEGFSPGARYNIDDITGGSIESKKALTGYTAWVYHKFLMDFAYPLSAENPGASGYGWHNTRGPETPEPDDPLPTGTPVSWTNAWGRVLNLYQKAIWAGMVETDVAGNPTGAVGDADAEFQISVWTDYEAIGMGYEDFKVSNWAGSGSTEAQKLAELFGYQVLNLGSPGAVHQDQIIPERGWTPTIPEPASLTIWSLIGLTFAAVWWRRKKSSLSN